MKKEITDKLKTMLFHQDWFAGDTVEVHSIFKEVVTDNYYFDIDVEITYAKNNIDEYEIDSFGVALFQVFDKHGNTLVSNEDDTFTDNDFKECLNAY